MSEQGYPAGCAMCRELRAEAERNRSAIWDALREIRIQNKELAREQERSKALAEALREIDAEAGCPAAEYVPALVRIWEIARAALEKAK